MCASTTPTTDGSFNLNMKIIVVIPAKTIARSTEVSRHETKTHNSHKALMPGNDCLIIDV